ncbi:ABC transporter permease [Amycolatopsis anabasis]|uniref:ABC transporter permease n=1 Tax=Amycolatopsis anabasis TaxID=1840409 RepID=UPI00131BA8C3|nr:ABC transporter permease [Amycolatopsis anabasis]
MGRVAVVPWRIVQAVPIAVGVTFLAFLMIHLIPGDPARTVLGTRATPEAIGALRHQWGLDEPWPVQYWRYLGRLLSGDLGQSLFYGRSTGSVIASVAGPTAWLVVYGTVLSLVLAVPLAVFAAAWRDRPFDHGVRMAAQVGLGLPDAWIGLLLILLFGLELRMFPVGGYGSGVLGHLESMFLPSLTIALGAAPVLIRGLRARLLEVLGADYITTARAKGLTEPRVLVRHALRNAAISAVTVLGVNIAWLVSGTVVVERVFAVPGLGNLLVESILRRDFPLVQSLTLWFALLVIAVNVLVDLGRALLDPRVDPG